MRNYRVQHQSITLSKEIGILSVLCSKSRGKKVADPFKNIREFLATIFFYEKVVVEEQTLASYNFSSRLVEFQKYLQKMSQISFCSPKFY
jgi:hypothetical protein